MTDKIITKEGLEALKKELESLQKQQPEIKAAMVEAREQGDLSENAGFHISKAKLGEVERRIGELVKIITDSRVIEKINTDKVGFGVYVKVFDEDKDSSTTFRIVNSNDLNQTSDNDEITLITMNAPVAKALMGKVIGDVVYVETRAGERTYKIVEIADKPI